MVAAAAAAGVVRAGMGAPASALLLMLAGSAPGSRWGGCEAAAVCTKGGGSCSSRFRLGSLEPRPWDVAEAMAANATRRMKPAEMNSLVYGSGWPPGSFTGPVAGHYTGNTPAIPHLGVPALKMQDAGQGYRPLIHWEVGSVTCWPSLLHLAASWDEELVAGVAAAIAREYVGKGSNVLLGPSVNVHRVARGGRNFEYLSGEDPYLGARLARAYVHGAQGEGVIAVAKHWAFNEQETTRMFQDSIVDARTAWELYYPPFEAAVEAGVGAFMCGYNKVNGIYACENDQLLNQDLKGTMGFRGFVQSDWGAVHSSGAIKRGLDQDMPGTDEHFSLSNLQDREHMYQYEAFMKGEKKEVSEMEKAARRVLSSMYRLKLDEWPGCNPAHPDGRSCWTERGTVQRSEEHSELNREAARAGVTLLHNDGVLPIDTQTVRKIAVMGCAAKAPVAQMGQQQMSGAFANMGGDFYSGGGSGKVFVRPDQVVFPVDAIASRAKQAGIEVLPGPATPNGTEHEIMRLANAADVVVVISGTTSAEMDDRKHLHTEYWNDVIVHMVARMKPTVVLLQVPGAAMTPWRGEVAAIASVFLAGEETAQAWAGLLFGDFNPAGKLPVMFPATYTDYIEPWGVEVPYSEGLFTSYRSRYFIPAFPFGHGISYTEFEYGTPVVLSSEACTAEACVMVEVRNTGHRAGAEVAQAYLDLSAVPNTPKRQLKGFHKTQVLSPGAAENVVFAFRERDLSFFDVETMGWKRVPGEIPVLIGSSVEDIRQRTALTVIE